MRDTEIIELFFERDREALRGRMQKVMVYSFHLREYMLYFSKRLVVRKKDDNILDEEVVYEKIDQR